MASGPHCGTDGASVPNCVYEVFQAASGLWAAIDRRIALIGATAPAVRITTAALSWKVIGATVALGAAVFAVGSAMNCISTLMDEPEPEAASRPRATSLITVANWPAARFATTRAFVLN